MKKKRTHIRKIDLFTDSVAEAEATRQENIANKADIHASLKCAAEQIKTLLSKPAPPPAVPPPAAVPRQEAKPIVLSAEDIACLAAPSYTLEWSDGKAYLNFKKSTISHPAPEDCAFVDDTEFTKAVPRRVYRKMRKKMFNFFNSEKKFKPPESPISTPPQRYSAAGAIEMVLQSGSGVNGLPIYKPKIM